MISGNARHGIEIEGDPSAASASGGFNRVQGNYIGVEPRAGQAGLGNGLDGVLVSASANTIGGQVSGAPNVISGNLGNGVGIAAQGVPVLSNSIYGNGGLGIDLLGGAPAANGGLNAPRILSITRSGAAATVSGSFAGAASSPYTLQFFSNPAGENQARTFLGTLNVTTGADGQTPFLVQVPTGVPVGGNVTVTATDRNGDTSELSNTAAGGPEVLDLVLSPSRNQITVNFSEAMDPTQAADPRSYVVTAPRAVAIRSVTLSADGRTAIITLKKAVPTGTFARVSINSASRPGLVSVQGVSLDGNADGQPGGSYVGRVAVGPKVGYTDASGHSVKLQVSKGGVAEVYRESNGNAQSVRLYGTTTGRSILSGTVKGKKAQTPIAVLILSGAINQLTNPPFIVGQVE